MRTKVKNRVAYNSSIPTQDTTFAIEPELPFHTPSNATPTPPPYSTNLPSAHPLLLTPNSTAAPPQSSP